MNKLTEEWIVKAEKDFLVAERELKADPPVAEAVCFHAQQCIEKYLKAVLQENKIEFERIHDLGILLERGLIVMPEIEKHRDELIKLSTFAVDVRYPGCDVTHDEARECFKIAVNARTVIRKYFAI